MVTPVSIASCVTALGPEGENERTAVLGDMLTADQLEAADRQVPTGGIRTPGVTRTSNPEELDELREHFSGVIAPHDGVNRETPQQSACAHHRGQ